MSKELVERIECERIKLEAILKISTTACPSDDFSETKNSIQLLRDIKAVLSQQDAVPVQIPIGSVTVVDGKACAMDFREGEADGEHSIYLEPRCERAKPFGYLVLDSSHNTEDFTRICPESINDTERVITLYAIPPSKAQEAVAQAKMDMEAVWSKEKSPNQIREEIQARDTAQTIEEWIEANKFKLSAAKIAPYVITEEKLRAFLAYNPFDGMVRSNRRN